MRGMQGAVAVRGCRRGREGREQRRGPVLRVLGEQVAGGRRVEILADPPGPPLDVPVGQGVEHADDSHPGGGGYGAHGGEVLG
jgi:hypothetical protein